MVYYRLSELQARPSRLVINLMLATHSSFVVMDIRTDRHVCTRIRLNLEISSQLAVLCSCNGYACSAVTRRSLWQDCKQAGFYRRSSSCRSAFSKEMYLNMSQVKSTVLYFLYAE